MAKATKQSTRAVRRTAATVVAIGERLRMLAQDELGTRYMPPGTLEDAIARRKVKSAELKATRLRRETSAQAEPQ